MPKTLEELKNLRKPIRNVNAEHREGLTKLENLALFITQRVGTMGFFLVIFIWTVFWFFWNSIGPISLRFDPFPAFVLWLFISNMIQIMLMPLILVGQNFQSRHSESRAANDFDLNIKTEREIEAILEHLENQNKLILEILSRFENEDVTALKP